MRRVYFLAVLTAALFLWPLTAGATELHYRIADEHRDEIFGDFEKRIAPIDRSRVIRNFRSMPELPWSSATINRQLFTEAVPQDVRRPIVENFYKQYEAYVRTPPSPRQVALTNSTGIFGGLGLGGHDQDVVRAHLEQLEPTWGTHFSLEHIFQDKRLSARLRNSPDLQQSIIDNWHRVYSQAQQERKSLPLPGTPFAEELLREREDLPGYDPNEKGAPLRDQGGVLERAIAAVIDGLTKIVQSLASLGGFEPLDKLIFNTGVAEKEKNYLPFAPDQWGLLDRWYNLIIIGFSGLVLLAVLVTAMKFIGSSVNAEMKADASESMMRWIGAVLLVGCAPVLVRVVFWLNNAMVDTLFSIVNSVLPDRIAQLPNFSRGMVEGLTDLSTGSVLGTAVVKLGFVGIMVYLNIIFIVRRFVLMVIYVFTPIVAWLWAMNKNVNAMGIWVGELLSNAFMQTAYAIAMLVFLTVNTDLSIGQGTWLTLLISLGAIVPVGEMLRNSIQGLWTRLSGVDESLTANRGMLGLIGLGSIASLGQSVAGRASMPITSDTPSGGNYSPGGPSMPPGGAGAANMFPGAVPGSLSLPGAGASTSPGGGTGGPLPGIFPGAVPGGLSPVGMSSGESGLSGPPGGTSETLRATFVPSKSGTGDTGTVETPALPGGRSVSGGGAPRGARVPQALAVGAAAASLAARAAAPFAAMSMAVVPGGDKLAQMAVQATAASARTVGTLAGSISTARFAAREQGVSFFEGYRQAAGVERSGFWGTLGAAGKVVGYSVSPGFMESVDQMKRTWSADGGLRV